MIELLAILVMALAPVDTSVPAGPAYRAQCREAAKRADAATLKAGYSDETANEMFAVAAFLCGASGASEDGSKP